MGSLSDHYKRIGKKLSASPTRVKSGTIITCQYKNRHGDSKSYVVMCINSNYQGKFHCYKLNNIEPGDLDTLASSYGVVEERGIQRINSNNPKGLYNKLKSLGERDYKMFNAKNMSATTICSYEYEV